MPTHVETRVDRRRAWGFRRPGRAYLVADRLFWMDCSRMPVPLDVCPCCGAGLAYNRRWTWINARAFLAQRACHGVRMTGRRCPAHKCICACVAGRAGLIWLPKAYQRRDLFYREADRLGVCLPCPALPRDYRPATPVFLGDAQALPNPDMTASPGIFAVILPRIEWVVESDGLWSRADTDTHSMPYRWRQAGAIPVQVRQATANSLLAGGAT